jgi:hypothetical protein
MKERSRVSMKQQWNNSGTTVEQQSTASSVLYTRLIDWFLSISLGVLSVFSRCSLGVLSVFSLFSTAGRSPPPPTDGGGEGTPTPNGLAAGAAASKKQRNWKPRIVLDAARGSRDAVTAGTETDPVLAQCGTVQTN